MAIETLCKQINIMKQIFDAFASVTNSDFNSQRYIDELTTLGLHIARADGMIDTHELRMINTLLGTRITPGSPSITVALAGSESKYTSTPPFSTAVSFMIETMMDSKIVQNNWETIYSFGYAVAMSSGGKDSREESYLNNYIDKLLSGGLLMGVSNHPANTISPFTLKGIEESAKK